MTKKLTKMDYVAQRGSPLVNPQPRRLMGETSSRLIRRGERAAWHVRPSRMQLSDDVVSSHRCIHLSRNKPKGEEKAGGPK